MPFDPLPRTAAGRVTAADLNRGIAVAQGWRVEKPVNLYICYTPQGLSMGSGFTPEQAWAETRSIPAYTTDLNAAMSLLEESDEIEFAVSRRMVSVWEAANVANRVMVGGATRKLSLAICCAWWTYTTGELLTVEDVE